MRWLYSAVGCALTPLLHVWFRRRAKRGKEVPSRRGERFGVAGALRPEGTVIWLHAASVGETQSILTLVQQLLQQNPSLHVLITTTTVTSAELIASRNIPRLIHQFAPADTWHAVRCFLQHWKPQVAVWVESELWPQLIWQTHARRIPMLLINGRMTQASFRGWQKWPRTIRSILACFHTIYAGSKQDQDHFAMLGKREILDVGNLKYDAAPLPDHSAQRAQLAAMIGDRPCWLAASTHAGEEEIIGRVHQELLKQFPTALCILVPRHAARAASIRVLLEAQKNVVAQRSNNESIMQHTSIYLADTMGELGLFFRLAPVVFLGGSLVPVGGHNPLEPLRLSCATITGPHTENFAAITHPLRSADALSVVANAQALTVQLAAWLHDPSQAKCCARNGLMHVTRIGGASAVIAQHVATLLQEKPL